MTDKRVTTILNEDAIQGDQQEAFAQQTKLGWTRIFTGYISTEWRKSTLELQQTWTSSCIRLFLDCGGGCWSHRNKTLYGPSTKPHQQRQKRLQDEARVWIDAPRTETLVPIHYTGTLKRDITRATSETIATWLHRQRQLRKQIRDNQKTSLITHFLSEDTLKEADQSFHGKLLAAQ